MNFNPIEITLEDFLSGNLKHLEQYHVIAKGEDSDRFEFFARPFNKSNKLICLMPSALPVNGVKPKAVFHRWSWSAHINENVIAINDPSFSIDGVFCGWFLGNGKKDLLDIYSRSVITIASKLGVDKSNIVFYGSSMGGFAALMMASLIPGAYAVAEVPQLDLLKYPIKSSIKAVESFCLNGEALEDFSLKKPYLISVFERFKKEKNVPGMTIITNSADAEFECVFDFSKSVSKLSHDIEHRGVISIKVHPDPIGHKPLSTPVAMSYLDAVLISKTYIAHGTSCADSLANKGPKEIVLDESYKKVLDEAIELAKGIKFIRTSEDRELYEKVVVKLKRAAELNKLADWPFLKICSIEKLWSNSFNLNILEAAEEAFKRRQTLEAFIYCCRGYLYNYSNLEAQQHLDAIVNKVEDKDIANVGNIFKSILCYERGDYSSYSFLIDSFRSGQSEGFKPYIAIPVSTVYTGSQFLTAADSRDELNICGKVFSVDNMDFTGKKYIVSISCDEKYFSIYGEYFIKSFSRHCSEEAVLHVSFLDGSAHIYREKIIDWGGQSVFFSIAGVDTQINKGPISSLLRFSVVHQLLEETGLPVLVLDLDTVIKKPFLELVGHMREGGVDIFSRVLEKGVAPWEKYTGGFAFFNSTDNSKLVAKNISYISEILCDSSVCQWWIDQNIFEAGIRGALINSVDLVVKNIFNIRDDYCVMPVGNQESKLFVLDKALSTFV